MQVCGDNKTEFRYSSNNNNIPLKTRIDNFKDNEITQVELDSLMIDVNCDHLSKKNSQEPENGRRRRKEAHQQPSGPNTNLAYF
jgi:ABC-type lipopolysaccharide export system ATPase subunit